MIINIKNKDYEMASNFPGIDIRVRMTSRKFDIKKKVFHFGITISRGFIKNINIFLKETNKAGFMRNVSPSYTKKYTEVDYIWLNFIPCFEG
jgi:hypothetical protein